MTKVLTKYRYFILPFIIWLIIGALVLIKINKGDLVLFFSNNRTTLGSAFFLATNKLAEWQFLVFIAAVLAYKKFGNTFIFLLACGIAGVVAQSLKRVFDMPRPRLFFADVDLHYLSSTMLTQHSFPSGHTTAAFTIFFMLVLMTDKKYLHFIYFLLALSVAFARVYLLQHFFMDIYFGSILGVAISYLVFVSINKSNIFGFQKWKNKRIGNVKI